MTNRLMCLFIFIVAVCVNLKAQTTSIINSLDSVVVSDSTLLTAVESKAKAAQIAEGIQFKADSILSATASAVIIDTIGKKEEFSPVPRKAVLYSAFLPGLGQIYNKKYWKLPLIYGGFFGFTYAISWNNRYYKDYFYGFRDLTDDDDSTNSWHNFLPYGQSPESADKKWLEETLRRRKDYYRRYRDMSIIGTAALYALNIIDAYVDASLFNFDMSPDLSMNIKPTAIQANYMKNVGNTAFGLQCSISF
ncbi:MAG: DUF5683 domain-containing protein [Dysgonamonadaceae bacterium]|nr:DUF5683 domain-containing protein [Dysgonamonadaceae bacterium]MDD3308886.1 DUF5683 domain-containing protein [Dysgonamonadaceae bacterium]MDD3900396.1 DUF5683 domain-containing protein [Dysgonamonadaceae bacterium]MDD4398242.1 DUF5683 domain-containing protein [Dysgonamonadaceae bacterium]MEA5080706.1 DUF5683 domain-containing protein [Dysgonamonadaceae bacterium]